MVCVQADKRTFKRYTLDEPCVLKLWQLCMLHSYVDCDYMGGRGFRLLMWAWRPDRVSFEVLMTGVMPHEPTLEEKLRDNVLRAEAALRKGELRSHDGRLSEPTYESMVDAEAFRAWSLQVGLPVLGPWSAAEGRGDSVGSPLAREGADRGSSAAAGAVQIHGPCGCILPAPRSPTTGSSPWALTPAPNAATDLHRTGPEMGEPLNALPP